MQPNLGMVAGRKAGQGRDIAGPQCLGERTTGYTLVESLKPRAERCKKKSSFTQTARGPSHAYGGKIGTGDSKSQKLHSSAKSGLYQTAPLEKRDGVHRETAENRSQQA